ncbi:hypothetical protein FNF27_04380 [Cafeteria roenbergensis]|uniref:Uncharacterized protein n=1 Tax=Cafeteria roenbergensis TaxID=33653 RepID=A0A5A8E9F9_CAFRO|nr:hypothetical protein FNF27_04380 [Cafeteria roenbergensis]
MRVIAGVIGIVFALPLISYQSPDSFLAVPRSMNLIDAVGGAALQQAAGELDDDGSAGRAVVSSNSSVSAAAADAARDVMVARLVAERPGIVFLRIIGATGGLSWRQRQSAGYNASAETASPSDWSGDPSAPVLGITAIAVAAGTALRGLESDPAVYVYRADHAASLRPHELAVFASGEGSQAVLDVSDAARLASLLTFVQTQCIIALMGLLALSLQRSIDVLLVWPIEKLSAFLKPVLSDAIAAMAQASAPGAGGAGRVAGSNGQAEQWRRALGADDGEELSTKLMLAAVDVLRRDLSAEARRNWARKALMSQMRSGDKAAGSIKRSMVFLQKNNMVAAGGGIRFQPVDDTAAALEAAKAKGGAAAPSLRLRTSVVPYSGLEAVSEVRSARRGKSSKGGSWSSHTAGANDASASSGAAASLSRHPRGKSGRAIADAVPEADDEEEDEDEEEEQDEAREYKDSSSSDDEDEEEDEEDEMDEEAEALLAGMFTGEATKAQAESDKLASTLAEHR